jgi:hypothetical protein
MTSLQVIWDLLEPTGLLRVAPTGVSMPAGEILAGFDNDGRRLLLIPLHPGEAATALTDLQSLRVAVITPVDGPAAGRPFLGLCCLTHDLDDLFVRLCDEILPELAAGGGSTMQRVRRILDRWRRLLAATTSRGPDDRRLIGLLSELDCLTEIVRRDPHRSVSCWQGPRRGVHDLVHGADAVEVKATLVRDGLRVGIHGIDQLAVPDGGTLHLVVDRWTPTSGVGTTLPGLVDGLHALGVDTDALAALLADAGVDPTDETLHTRAFKRTDRRIWPVGPGFPRLIRAELPGGDLPSGIVSVDYVIDLTTDPGARLDPTATDALWARMAS